MGKYIIAPAGTAAETSKILKKCIEYIGSTQAGFGSNLSKGKRYLKSIKGCSCTSVKYLYQAVPKTVGHDFQALGIFVHKYDKDKCAETLLEIISFIENHSNDDIKNKLFDKVIRPCLYIDPLYSKQKSNLEWVETHDYKGQGEDAQKVLKNIDSITITLK